MIGNIVSIHPKGYVFFGTAIRIVDEIKRHTLFNATGKSLFTSGTNNKNKYGSLSQNITLDGFNSEELSDTFDNTEFVVMDFSAVVGVDATAARSCFLLLTRLLRASSVRVVFTGMTRDIERLLRSNGVLDECVVFPEADDALEWCEENVLARLRFEEGWEDNFRSNSSGDTLQLHSPSSRPSSPLEEYSEPLKMYSNAHSERQKIGSVKHTGSFNGDNSVRKSSSEASSPVSTRGVEGSSSLLLSSAHDQEYEIDLPVTRTRSRSTSKCISNTFVASMKGSMSHDDLTNLKPSVSQLRVIFDEHLETHKSLEADRNSLGLKIDEEKDVTRKGGDDSAASTATLEKYFSYKNLSRGRILFDVGSNPKRLFVIVHGSVEIVTRKVGMEGSSSIQRTYVPYSSSSSSTSSSTASHDMSVERVYKMSAGSIVGEAEFLLQKPYTTRCFAATAVGLWVLDLDSYHAMSREHPGLYHELQQVLLKSLSIANMTGIFHLHPSSTYHIGGLFPTATRNSITVSSSGPPPLLASKKFQYIYDKVDMQ
jgi:CRP-like cAMP-binding protein/anti-anti-sigma regulatory factor